MTRALLDAERLVTSHRHPGDARRTEIVERERLARLVAREEFGARHACRFEVVANEQRQLTRRRQREAALLGRSLLEAFEQGDDVGLDGDAARLARLRRLHLPGVAVDGLGDVDDTVLEVDVVPRERAKLTRARERVDGNRVEHASVKGHLLVGRGDQLQELARVQELFRLARAALGTADFVRRVIVADSEVEPLRMHGVIEQLRDETPDVHRRLPRDVLCVVRR